MIKGSLYRTSKKPSSSELKNQNTIRGIEISSGWKRPSSLNYLFTLSKPNLPNKQNMGVPQSCFGKPTGSIINTSNYPRKQSTGVHRGAQGSRKESIWESEQRTGIRHKVKTGPGSRITYFQTHSRNTSRMRYTPEPVYGQRCESPHLTSGAGVGGSLSHKVAVCSICLSC